MPLAQLDLCCFCFSLDSDIPAWTASLFLAGVKFFIIFNFYDLNPYLIVTGIFLAALLVSVVKMNGYIPSASV